MGTPVLFLVDEDRPALEALAADLGRRFGADYQILAEPSPMAALTRLGHLGAQSQPVALLLMFGVLGIIEPRPGAQPARRLSASPLAGGRTCGRAR